MTPGALGVGVILTLIIITIAYLKGKPSYPQDSAPNVSEETYLYYDPEKPSPTIGQARAIAHNLGGSIATPGEVAYYASLGGRAGWCGLTSTGGIYSVPGEKYVPQSPVTSQPCGQSVPFGVWVTGPKIVAGSKNVSPFSCANWYQPAQ